MKNGGSAFPVVDSYMDPFTGVSRLDCLDRGMSLRDYFAGQALVGLVQEPFKSRTSIKELTEWSYTIADSMLAEREKDQ